MNIKTYNKGNGFISGECDIYKFDAKVYNTGSKLGINNGRVSKLTICDEYGNWLVNYDRGWDTEPQDEVVDVYANIMEVLENI